MSEISDKQEKCIRLIDNIPAISPLLGTSINISGPSVDNPEHVVVDQDNVRLTRNREAAKKFIKLILGID
jgi:hypothetical protein